VDEIVLTVVDEQVCIAYCGRGASVRERQRSGNAHLTEAHSKNHVEALRSETRTQRLKLQLSGQLFSRDAHRK
jgi:hypothetical protein